MIAVMDTSAIVEIMRGTEAGRKALEVLGDADLVVIPSIVLAELTSYVLRNGIDLKYVREVEKGSLVAELDGKIARSAGKRHAKLRKLQKGISLADCIVMATAKEYDGVVITKDHHFELYEGEKIIIG
jgi:predicted nucleic acid-binding protein